MRQQKPLHDWENLSVISRNKEPGHAHADVYDDAKDAVHRVSPPYKLLLNGQWRFLHQYGSLLPKDVTLKDFDDTAWDTISVPGVWQLQGYGMPYYYALSYPQSMDTRKRHIPRISHTLQEAGIFRRSFGVPENFFSKCVYLYLGAAKAALAVYLNGQFVGYSQGSMTPHEFDVTSYLCKGHNQLTVVVWRYSDGTYLEDQDMWFMSGIYRDVFLYAEPNPCIRDYYMYAGFDDGLQNALTSITLWLQSDCPKKDVTVSADIPELNFRLGERTLDLLEDTHICFSASIPSPDKWSPECPRLYTILLTIQHNGITYYKVFRFGFKKVDIKGNILFLNGQRLIIRGVNRHDFDPDTGWTLSREQYVKDIRILKQLGINSLRTSHYPNAPYLYELCDEYGILVMDEADLETHGVRRILPRDDARWLEPCLDRVRRMVLRDRNHACIFFWSLGNEAGSGTTFACLRREIQSLDATRPFHYEGEHTKASSDVISRMYPDETTLTKLCNKQPLSKPRDLLSLLSSDSKELRAEQYRNMPVLLCEFAHAMENSLGNFKEYTDAFSTFPHMCGGYIWDFSDQSIHRRIAGKDHWLYGDDFSELYDRKGGYKSPLTTGSNRYFCANGILAADRTFHPAAFEVKKCFQTLRITQGTLQGQFILHNDRMFTTLSDVRLLWSITADGNMLADGEVHSAAMRNLQPQASCAITLPILSVPADADVLITFQWILAQDTLWEKAGFEVAFEQFSLQRGSCKQRSLPKNSAAIQLTGDHKKTIVTGTDFQYTFECGVLTGALLDGRKMLLSPILPSYYRAQTDNDRNESNFVPQLLPFMNCQRWKNASSRMRPSLGNVEANDNSITLSCLWRHPLLSTAQVQYTVYADGSIEIRHTAVSKKLEMQRAGLQFSLPCSFKAVRWYGRGPHENYPDRKSGARKGLYEMTVPELEHRYMRPQENGARCDVDLLEILDDDCVLCVRDLSGQGMIFSARPYTQSALDSAEHSHELQAENLTQISLDSAMCGVGGNAPGFLKLHHAYTMPAKKEYALHLLLRWQTKNARQTATDPAT